MGHRELPTEWVVLATEWVCISHSAFKEHAITLCLSVCLTVLIARWPQHILNLTWKKLQCLTDGVTHRKASICTYFHLNETSTWLLRGLFLLANKVHKIKNLCESKFSYILAGNSVGTSFIVATIKKTTIKGKKVPAQVMQTWGREAQPPSFFLPALDADEW
jgi:hypothetical protein